MHLGRNVPEGGVAAQSGVRGVEEGSLSADGRQHHGKDALPACTANVCPAQAPSLYTHCSAWPCTCPTCLHPTPRTLCEPLHAHPTYGASCTLTLHLVHAHPSRHCVHRMVECAQNGAFPHPAILLYYARLAESHASLTLYSAPPCRYVHTHLHCMVRLAEHHYAWSTAMTHHATVQVPGGAWQ